MDNQLDRIENKVDKINDHLAKVDVTLVSQHLTLLDHTSRSTKLEEIVLPMQTKINYVEGFLKGLGLLGIIAGIADVAIRLFFHH